MGAANNQYQHAEAYCLMRYRDEVTGKIEVIWNSRDGVTPMGVRSRTGNMSTHVEWNLDRRDPYHVPEVGDRIFVTMTPLRARALAAQNVERHWNTGRVPMRECFGSKEEAIRTLAQQYLAGGEGPDILVVNAAMRDEFAARRPRPRRFA